MKKFISTGLAALMLISTFVGCSSPQSESKTSSEAGIERFTAYLEEHLDEMPDSLVVATAEDATTYGVDMTNFAQDGYFTRAEDGDVVILGKSDNGLDRAVRDFVKYGNDDDYFKVYNEGYRVKKLTIAGNDISEYAVVRSDDADECHTYAASELVTYIQKTCGVTIPSYTVSEYAEATDKPQRTITLAVDYPALGDEAFSIEVGEGGNMTILGGRYRGCLLGVYDLLHDMGWRFTGGQWYSTVTGTKEYLYESEHVDLTSSINRSESPAIPVRDTRTREIRLLENNAVNDNYSRGGYGMINGLAHGLQNYHSQIFSGDYEDLYLGLEREGKQPCYSNEEIYEAVEAWAFNRIASYLETRTIEEVPAVDISQWDAFEHSFCLCETCKRVKQEERSTCGAVLRMANRLADSLNTTYPGAKVHILAYAGTEKLPKKTLPNENIIVGYCFHIGSCSNHSISGVDCPSGSMNSEHSALFEEWMEVVAPGQMIVWYYPFTAYPTTFNSPIYTVIRQDMKYFAESGIEYLYVCAGFTNTGLVNDQLAAYLCAIFAWDYDYTKEEEFALIEEWFNIIYGDAGYYMYEYAMLCEVAADRTGCWLSFGSTTTEKVDTEFMAEHFDYLWGQYLKAKEVADTTVIEQLVEQFMAGMMYMCIGVTYEDRYTNGTEEQRAVIAERYTEMYNIFKKYNIPIFYDLLETGYVPDTLNLDVNPMDDWRYLENKW